MQTNASAYPAGSRADRCGNDSSRYSSHVSWIWSTTPLPEKFRHTPFPPRAQGRVFLQGGRPRHVCYIGVSCWQSVMSEPPAGLADRPGKPPDELIAALFDRLKQLAHQQLNRGARKTLDTTELVHELYLRVIGGRELAFEH